METKVVIFDCDGVLLDTKKSVRAYYDTLFREVGVPLLTDSQFKDAFMNTVEEAILQFIQNPQQQEKARALQRSFDNTPFLNKIEIAPTTLPFLGFLHQFVKTAVVTNRAYSMPTITKRWSFDKYFDLIISAMDVSQPKPHPEGLNKVLATFNLSPKEALFVGDSPVDELAAKRAQIPFVAFQNKNLSAVYHIHELPQLAEILKLPA